MKFPFRSLRDFLTYLEGQGQVATIKGEVDPNWEIAFISKEVHMKQGPALLYENLKGYSGWRLADHVLGTYDRCFAALSTTREKAFDDYATRVSSLVTPKVIKDAPFKEVRLEGEGVDLSQLPVPRWGECDGGPYITSGAVMARDPEIGYQNMAIYRMQVKRKNTTGILIHMPQHIGHIQAKYEAKGQAMPLAVAIGVDPLISLCCEASVPYGVSELDVWGALAGQPLEVVQCETSDLLVPASAEIVLEGIVPPGVREPEGPFGEFTGYYSGVYNCHLFQVQRLFMRRDPIYQGMYVGRPPTEGILIEGLMQCLEAVRYLRESIPQVKAMRVLGTSAIQGVIAVDKKTPYPGLARRVGCAMWSSRCGHNFKNIVVVDDDIDIFSDADIWWAMATRFQGDRDLIVIPDTLGVLLDPSEVRLRAGEVQELVSLTCRTIFDCTQPHPPFDEGYKRGVVDQPAEVKERVMKRWKELGLP